MKSWQIRLLWLLLVFPGAAVSLRAAAGPVRLSRNVTKVALGGNAQVLVDPAGSLTRSRAAAAPGWKVLDAVNPGFGYTSAVYWVRMALTNTSGEIFPGVLELEYPHLDTVRCTLVLDDGSVTERDSGDRMPFHQRYLRYRNITFPVVLKPGQRGELWLRVQTTSSMVLEGWLWDEGQLRDSIVNEQLYLGLYYGLLLAILIYHLFLYSSLRDAAYGYYILWILGFGLYQFTINGLSFQFLWPGSPGFGNQVLVFFISFGTFWCYQFGRTFLKTREFHPRTDFWLRLLLGLAALQMAASFVLPYRLTVKVGILNVFAMGVLMTLAGIFSMRRRYRPARYYSLAFASLLAGVMLFGFKTFGLLPGNFITVWGQLIGSALQVTLLALALVNRIRLMEEARRNAQQHALELLQQNTEEQQEFVERISVKNTQIEALNRELEDRVQDLNETNEELLRSRQRYQLLLEGSSDIIFLMDREWRIVQINKAVLSHLRFQPEKIVGKKFLDFLHEGASREGMLQHFVARQLEEFASTGRPVQFRAEFMANRSAEPRELEVSLQYIELNGSKEIFGRAKRIEEDVLTPLIVRETRELSLNNYLLHAEDVSARLTRHLYRYFDEGDAAAIRIALREMLINAIEHGNLEIDFDMKSAALEQGEYFDLVSRRQNMPEFKSRRVQVLYTLDHSKVEYCITDQGPGFDTRKMLQQGVEDSNREMLAHGRGLHMTRAAFDLVEYNEKGNSVRLVRRFPGDIAKEGESMGVPS